MPPSQDEENIQANTNIKEGDYFLHVFFEEFSSLKSPSVDSVMEVKALITAFGRTRASRVKSDVSSQSNVYVGEHFHFQKRFNSAEEIKDSILKIELVDVGLLTQKLGSCEFSVPIIYYQKDHVIQYQWITLVNLSDKEDTPTGFIKISMSLTRNEEKMVELLPETSDQRLDLKKTPKIQMLANLKMEKTVIRITVYAFDKLVGMDRTILNSSLKSSDPFIVAQIGSIGCQTSVSKNYKVNSPPRMINEKLHMVTTIPSYINDLTISLRDYDTIAFTNDIFGSINFSLKDIMDKHYDSPFWCYVYGGHPDVDNENVKKMMNTYPSLASRFKGAVYLKIEDIKNLKFKSSKEKIKNIKEEAVLLPPQKFVAYVKLFSVVDLQYIKDSHNKHEQQLKVSWGSTSQRTSVQHIDSQRFITFNQVIRVEEQFRVREKHHSEDERRYRLNIMKDLPDIFIILHNCEQNRDVAFLRYKPSEYCTIEGSEVKFDFFNKDDQHNEVKMYRPGHLSYKMVALPAIYESRIQEEFGQVSSGMRPVRSNQFICVNLVQAKNLAATDGNSLSDPIVFAEHFQTYQKSSLREQTLNPIYAERLIVSSYKESFDREVVNYPLVISLYDRDQDTFTESEAFEFMGRTVIDLRGVQLSQNYDDIATPEWHDLIYEDSEKFGKVLLSFSLHSSAPVRVLRPLKDNSMTSLYMIKLQILGLRKLKSSGVLGVLHPYITIDTSSVVDLESPEQPITLYTCESKDGGANCTIAQVINIQGKLFKMDVGKPSITCQVFDTGVFQVGDTMVGSFEIDLERSSFFTKIKLIKVLNQLKVLCQKYKLNSKIPEIEEIKKYLMDQFAEEVAGQSGDQLQKIFPEMYQEISRTQNEIGDKNLNRKNLKTITGLFNKNRSKTLVQRSLEFSRGGGFNQKQPEESANLLQYKEATSTQNEAVKDINVQGNRSILERSNANDSLPVVIMPVYLNEEKMIEKLNPVLQKNQHKYKQVGFDGKGNIGSKHYRLKIGCPLEQDETFFSQFCDSSIPIKRGKAINLEDQNNESSFWQTVFSKNELQRTVGTFKGFTMVVEKDLLHKLEALNLDEHFQQLAFPSSIASWSQLDSEKDLLRQVKAIVVVYVLDADMYESFDAFSENDCYMIIKLDDQVIKDTQNVVADKEDPIFNLKYRFDHEFPGKSNLKIEFWDQDIAIDDKIGELEIDLEDRFFNEKFRQQKDLPIETHKIKDPKTGMVVGTVDLWVDIFKRNPKPKANTSAPLKKNQALTSNFDRKQLKLWNVESAPPQKMELRVVVWETTDVPNNDIEDMSDIYVQGVADLGIERPVKTTDTHYRASNGFGSFNWRLVYPVLVDEYLMRPQNVNKLSIEMQIWDRDLLSSNDFLSSVQFSLKELLQKVVQTGRSHFLLSNGKVSESRSDSIDFWCETNPNKSDQTDESLKQKSHLKMRIQLVTEAEAKSQPVGEGREIPNQDPYLPEPVGRWEFSWNPITLMGSLVGPAFKRQCCCLVCGTCCCFFLLFMMVAFIASLFNDFLDAINPLTYIFQLFRNNMGGDFSEIIQF